MPGKSLSKSLKLKAIGLQIPEQQPPRHLPFTLILGSASPRRKALMEALGFPFNVLVSDVDELHPPELKGAAIAEYIATLKAKALRNHIGSTDLIITADTIVIKNQAVLHKPGNKNEALEMLKFLAGGFHDVITAVCFMSQREAQVFHVTTRVYFTELSTYDIEYYINQFKPLDKAGGYGIQEWIGHVGIERIEGSYTNVMGLPTHLVYKKLMDMAG